MVVAHSCSLVYHASKLRKVEKTYFLKIFRVKFDLQAGLQLVVLFLFWWDCVVDYLAATGYACNCFGNSCTDSEFCYDDVCNANAKACSCPQNWIGDGDCDHRCETPECHYDAGDCGNIFIYVLVSIPG